MMTDLPEAPDPQDPQDPQDPETGYLTLFNLSQQRASLVGNTKEQYTIRMVEIFANLKSLSKQERIEQARTSEDHAFIILTTDLAHEFYLYELMQIAALHANIKATILDSQDFCNKLYLESKLCLEGEYQSMLNVFEKDASHDKLDSLIHAAAINEFAWQILKEKYLSINYQWPVTTGMSLFSLICSSKIKAKEFIKLRIGKDKIEFNELAAEQTIEDIASGNEEPKPYIPACLEQYGTDTNVNDQYYALKNMLLKPQSSLRGFCSLV